MSGEKIFSKYRDRGSMHWREMTSRSIRRFNAFQQARYDWIIKTAGDTRGKKVLDIGCGDGALSYLLAKTGALVTGVDNEELGLKFARENFNKEDPERKLRYEFIPASAYELPLADESFDLVVSCEVIEHLQYPEKMLAEARRVLRPGGKLILTTPYRLRETPSDPNHVREFFPQELEGLVATHFRVVQTKLTHQILWYGIFTYSIRHFGNRQIGMWLINALTLWFGINPFNFDYKTPTKRDIFTEILIEAEKK